MDTTASRYVVRSFQSGQRPARFYVFDTKESQQRGEAIKSKVVALGVTRELNSRN